MGVPFQGLSGASATGRIQNGNTIWEYYERVMVNHTQNKEAGAEVNLNESEVWE